MNNLQKRQKQLKKLKYGCKSGYHISYAISDVNDQREACEFVPGFLLNKAPIVEVDIFDHEAIASLTCCRSSDRL